MKRAIVIALAAIVLLPEPVDAVWPRIDRARTIAVNWWSQWPEHCEWVPTYKADLEGKTVARAHVKKCYIEVDRAWYESVRFRLICAVYIHEWGHMVGWRNSDPDAKDPYHSEDSHHMMYRTPGRIPRVCRQR